MESSNGQQQSYWGRLGPGTLAVVAEKWDLDKLEYAKRMMEDIEQHDGWGLINELIEGAELYVNKTVRTGPILTQAEYARFMGVLEGIRLLPYASKVIVTVAKTRLESDAVETSSD